MALISRQKKRRDPTGPLLLSHEVGKYLNRQGRIIKLNLIDLELVQSDLD